VSQFVPLTRMLERVETDKADSDVAAFYSLLFYGEMLTKLVVVGLVAAIEEDRDRNRYRLLHGLVRANGIGEWASILDEILTGPASQYLLPAVRQEQRQLTERVSSGNWQHCAVQRIQASAEAVGIHCDALPHKVAARQWFALFALFRNKTRGHGAVRGQQCADVCADLEESINLIAENFRLFQRPWAYLHRNLSGRYRVTSLGGNAAEFDYLKTQAGEREHLPDGVYLALDSVLRRVELMESDVDASDFLLANGQFSSGRYELLSYITNERSGAPGQKYLEPIDLPLSQTQGAGTLDIIGNCFSNLPPQQQSYIRRDSLEEQLLEQLCLERHPIVTLTGPGGIGKTTLALKVLYDLAHADDVRYEVIVWFSARDIDLLIEGAKPVRPHVVTLEEFACEYVNLLQPAERENKGFKPARHFASALSCNAVGPTLFVFDNFETVADPAEIFHWIDTHIRSPNKVLITTRMREFVGDYPLEVSGMTEEEADLLIDSTARQLGVHSLITPEYASEVYRESDGHPYVMKILLGEVAKANRLVKPERIVATQEEILTALFERSYATLAPAAQRVFLLLCNWRSVVPELALEAVVLRSENERLNVHKALDELKRTSFIEELASEQDPELFISVPFAAMAFGKRKLTASPMKAAVEADTQLLQAFGAARKEDVRHGVLPRVQRLLTRIAGDVAKGKESLEDSWPMLEFIGRRVPAAWLDIAKLYTEQGTSKGLERAKQCLRLYLEKPDKQEDISWVWKRLADLCRGSQDYGGEVHALVEMCQVPAIPLHAVSNAANRINNINFELKRRGLSVFDSEERKILVRKVAEVMDQHAEELDATDCSRLAWLYLHVGNARRARELAEQGSQLEPSNEHCQSLLASLSHKG
jgi:hypothetical protein